MSNQIVLELCPSADEPPVHAPEARVELDTVSRALRSTGATFSQLMVSLHATNAFDYPSASFLITTLAKPALEAVGVIVAAWIHARTGRKVRLQVGDIEIEARTPEEIDQLLKSAVILGGNHKLESKD
jgi:hypothetical protein